MKRWLEISLLPSPVTTSLEHSPFPWNYCPLVLVLPHDMWVLLRFSSFLISASSFILSVSVLPHLGSSSQAVFSWRILYTAWSFTLIVLTTFSKTERTSSCISATVKSWAACLCTVSTLNSTFQKLSKSLLSSSVLLVPNHAGITC